MRLLLNIACVAILTLFLSACSYGTIDPPPGPAEPEVPEVSDVKELTSSLALQFQLIGSYSGGCNSEQVYTGSGGIQYDNWVDTAYVSLISPMTADSIMVGSTVYYRVSGTNPAIETIHYREYGFFQGAVEFRQNATKMYKGHGAGSPGGYFVETCLFNRQ